MAAGKLRTIGLGMVATAGVGAVGLGAWAQPATAHADDIGLVLGGSGTPIPGADYVEAANNLYLDNPGTTLYPDLTYYQATADNPYGNGLYTPEGFYPGTGVHTLPIVYPVDADGIPTQATSIGQGTTIVVNTIESDIASGNTATMFGYSQSSVIAGYVMQELQADGVEQNDVNFLLVGDPANPNGGLFERFAGFETLSGQTVSDQLTLPSLGLEFGGSTPADDYATNIYTLEYDGYADFPRYPLNFLSDLNAFLGGEAIHGSYLDGDPDIAGPTAADIAGATLLPGSALDGVTDSLTNYYMIDETPPLVALLPAPLQALLGPDLTYLINLGYGDGSEGYSVTADAPANVATPFGLFPDVSLSQIFNTLSTDTQQGITAFEAYLADPSSFVAATSPFDAASTGQSMAEVLAALQADAADPTATITELVNAISTVSSAAYSTLLPTADIINSLVTSMPAYDLSLFTENLANGDLLDAIGLPLAADTALVTLAGGFELEVLQSAASEISTAFAGLF